SSSIGTGAPAPAVDLTTCLAPYIPTGIPMDPNGGTSIDTKYQISVDSLGRYLVCAPASSEAALSNPAILCVKR
ncbi:MAG: hypothetical protein V4436_03510, partial [Patescibacteria group bacterium]